MENKLRVALVGFGGMGQIYAKMIYAGMIPEMQLLGVCCRNEKGQTLLKNEFSGVSIGWEEDVTVYGVQFYKVGEVVRDRYDKIKQECLYSLQEISPRYFSEIVLLLTTPGIIAPPESGTSSI